MSQRIRLVQGDTTPPIVVSIKSESTHLPLDLSDGGTTVFMRFRAAGTTTVLETLTGTKLTGQLMEDGTLDTTVTPAGRGGRVQFDWGSNSLDRDPGNYEGEIEITFGDGSVQTVYELLRFTLREDFG